MFTLVSVVLNENAELIDIAKSGVASLNHDQQNIMGVLRALSLPDISIILVVLFIILAIAAAYAIIGIILFVIFVNK